MADTATVENPNVGDRHDLKFWAAPIGVGTVLPKPVFLSDLPDADPEVAGQLWANSGVATVSAGS